MFSKARKRKVFWLVLLTVVIFALYFSTIMIGRKYHDSFVEIYGLKFLPTTINGSIQALIFILCIVLVFIDSFWGTGIALAFSILSISSVMRTVVKDLNLLNIPGVFNGIFNIVAIAFIGWQVRVRNKRRVTDSVTGLRNRVGFTEVLGDYVSLSDELPDLMPEEEEYLTGQENDDADIAEPADDMGHEDDTADMEKEKPIMTDNGNIKVELDSEQF